VFKELDTVVLNRDLAEHGLKRGDVGAIVHCHPDGAAYEVEFVNAGGGTVALLTLKPADIRLMAPTEILHARQLAG
jgi:hypothetical protein